jgi:hypothetical protein
MRTAVVLTCLLLTAHLALAEERTPAAVADRYLAAISASDWEAMRALLAEEAHYEDRTMALFERGAVDLHGADAIVDFWRTSADGAGSSAVRFERRGGFVAGPVVVLELRVHVDNDGAAWGMPGVQFTGEMDLVTLVQVHDGRVVWHMDAADYAAAQQQVEALERAFRAGAAQP